MNIWKYELEIVDDQSVNMPFGATILTVQVQNDIPCVWALVEPSNSAEPRAFHIAGTGHPFDGGGKYVGTFQLHDGALVFHVFDRGYTT